MVCILVLSFNISSVFSSLNWNSTKRFGKRYLTLIDFNISLKLSYLNYPIEGISASILCLRNRFNIVTSFFVWDCNAFFSYGKREGQNLKLNCFFWFIIEFLFRKNLNIRMASSWESEGREFEPRLPGWNDNIPLDHSDSIKYITSISVMKVKFAECTSKIWNKSNSHTGQKSWQDHLHNWSNSSFWHAEKKLLPQNAS